MLKNLPLEHQVESGEGLRTPTLPRGRSWQLATRSLESTPFSHHRLIRQIGLVTIAVVNPRAIGTSTFSLTQYPCTTIRAQSKV